jgi:gas vesicle protein
MSAKSTLLTFLAGAAAGAVAGILLAPDSGVNTRRRLSQAALDLRTQMADEFSRLNELKDKAYSQINKTLKRETSNQEVAETAERF